jgi:hypothetical protein
MAPYTLAKSSTNLASDSKRGPTPGRWFLGIRQSSQKDQKGSSYHQFQCEESHHRQKWPCQLVTISWHFAGRPMSIVIRGSDFPGAAFGNSRPHVATSLEMMINDGDSEEQRSPNGPPFASLWSFYIIIVHPEYVIEPCMEPIIQIKETTNRLKKQTISCFLFVHVWFDWVLWKIDLFAISVVKHSIQLNSIFLGILGCLWRGHPCGGQLGAPSCLEMLEFIHHAFERHKHLNFKSQNGWLQMLTGHFRIMPTSGAIYGRYPLSLCNLAMAIKTIHGKYQFSSIL